MYDVLLWFWTAVLAATVLWWAIMLFRVAFIGPLELLAMFRSLKGLDEGEIAADSKRGE